MLSIKVNMDKKKRKPKDLDALNANKGKLTVDMDDSDSSEEECDDLDQNIMAKSMQTENPAKLIDLDLVNLLKYCH